MHFASTVASSQETFLTKIASACDHDFQLSNYLLFLMRLFKIDVCGDGKNLMY